MYEVDILRKICSKCSKKNNREQVRKGGYKRTKKTNTVCPRCGKAHYLKNADTKVKRNLCGGCINSTTKSGAYYIDGNERYL
jgi:ribosomal protein S27AE